MANARRSPVVAERSPLTEHYVADGITGVLLPEGDPPYLAAAVARVLARGELRATFGNAGRARVEREFSERAMIEGFEQAAVGRRRGLRGRRGRPAPHRLPRPLTR